jgi:hypothetical protein
MARGDVHVTASLTRHHVAAAALTLAAVTTPLAAQDVRGVVRTASVSGAAATPLGEVAVVLVGADGLATSGAITDTNGTFILHAPSPGRYRVRARRLGFAPDSSAVLDLASGATVTFDPVLRTVAEQLTTVHVAEHARCALPREAERAALQLWESAQAALAAAAVTAQEDRDGAVTGFVLRRYSRDIDPATSVVWRRRTWQTRVHGAEPYSSVPAESLVAHGFMRKTGDSTTYFLPDARTLTSDAFARTHCFRTVMGDSTHAGLVGLAFEPVKRDRAGDVAGTLWVDSASAELRVLEYHYTGAGALMSLGLGPPSGRLGYARLPGGRWIVRHWMLRVPVIGAAPYLDPSVPRDPVSEQAIGARLSHFASIYEAGGDVLDTFVVGREKPSEGIPR